MTITDASGTVPYEVVTPPQTMTFTVTKVVEGTNLSISTDGLNRTSPAVQKQTKVLIKYTPKGLSFPFYCKEPVSDTNPSGNIKTFNSEQDIYKNPGFEVIPDQDTKYSVTCYN